MNEGGFIDGPPVPVFIYDDDCLLDVTGRCTRVDDRHRCPQRKQPLVRMVAELDALTDPVARAVLDLHVANEWGRCMGCDFEVMLVTKWPCRTVLAVAKVMGIEAP